MQHAQDNLYTFPQPQAGGGMPASPQGYLPSFPVLAQQVDAYATRIPWYVWLGVGAFLWYRFGAPRRGGL